MARKTYTLQDAIAAEPRVIRSTWGMAIQSEVPALCEDGDVRLATYGAADTWFSCPAKMRVGAKTVYGYVTRQTLDGYETETPDDPAVYKFVELPLLKQDEARRSYRASIQP